ncbi:hypothetical protein E1265_18545 [Streptomyces sp. 8K308]|uniref:hypothetical protein n=1 Tax=Streptomyces sp. 8K308 TaxID=2530388 RepID=UPI00104CACE4|nr:hypothetical protein [Streptomyces sp. 8K308]TDC21251.1 hypothetical protein E1265_18545 [Streptomyces sp. 8K308]
MSEPIAYAALWRPVMKAAGFRCQCRGECGNPHKSGQGRCPREHDQHASRHRGGIVRLIAAPADPSLTGLAAARADRSQLRAWCPDCHDNARRAANRAARTEVVSEQGGLFEIEP